MKRPTVKQEMQLERLLHRLGERWDTCSPVTEEDLDALISMCRRHLGMDEATPDGLHTGARLKDHPQRRAKRRPGRRSLIVGQIWASLFPCIIRGNDYSKIE